MKLQGRVWKFGDNVDRIRMITARLLNVSDKDVLARHSFIGLRPGFVSKVSLGDLIVTGEDFGCD